MNYATFWKRGAAYLLDNFIAMLLTYPAQFIIAVLLSMLGADKLQLPVSLLISVVVFLGYYVWPESSSWQATVGKRLFNLHVTDLNGQRLSFWRSLGRHAGKIVSSLLLCIGFLMCFWTPKRQCLHDMIANCLVIDPTPQERNGWVVAVFILSILAFLLISLVFTLLTFAIASAVPVQ